MSRPNASGDDVMNWSTISGTWDDAKGQIKSVWARLTDDDLMHVDGHKDRLVAFIQGEFGISREQAEEQLNEFMTSGASWLAKAKEGAQDFVDKGREYIEKGVAQGREYADHGRDYMQRTSISEVADDLTRLIGRHPLQSAIFGLGLGLIIGRYLTPPSRS